MGTVMRMHICAHIVMKDTAGLDLLAGLPVIRRTRHPRAGSYRMQREYGHQ
jgi:hypothetical protein